MIYLLDANTLIEAKNRYYSMTICPGYWTWILQSHGKGIVASIDAVGNELKQGHDELAAWAIQNDQLFWDASDGNTQEAFAKVAVEEFLAGADPWLIAKAMTMHDCVVVTHEQFNPQMKRKFSIPNVCQTFGIQWINTFQALDATGAEFRLQ
jgi:hypothetical protein